MRSKERVGGFCQRASRASYKGRSGENEAVEEEALRSSSQREGKQGKSSKKQPDCKGRRCPLNSNIREGNEGEKSGHNSYSPSRRDDVLSVYLTYPS